jgi:serine/threonine protein kinase
VVDLSEYEFDAVSISKRSVTGGTSNQWRAVHRGSRCPVLVTQLSFKPSHSRSSGEQLQEFVGKECLQMVLTLASAAHPCITSVVGWNLSVERPECEFAIVTEFTPSSLLQHPKLTPTQQLIVLYGVARALQFLHAMGLTHRGIRPSNILLDSEMYPKLVAIGVRPTSTTRDDNRYIAPEKLNRTPLPGKPTPYAEDIFSFGVVAFEVTEGKPAIRDSYSPLGPAPAFSDGNQMSDVINHCWADNRLNRCSSTDIVKMLQNPAVWPEGVDPSEFRRFNAFLDVAEKAFAAKRFPKVAIRNLNTFLDPKAWPGPDRPTDLPTLTAAMLGYIVTPAELGGPNPDVIRAVTDSLAASWYLDPHAMPGWREHHPVPKSLFAQTVVQLNGLPANCPAEFQVDANFAVAMVPDEAAAIRSIVLMLRAEHQTLVNLVGWNVDVARERVIIVTEVLERLTKDTPVTKSEQMCIVFGLAKAVARLHSFGIVHGGLSPDCVLLEKGNRVRLRVGLATRAATMADDIKALGNLILNVIGGPPTNATLGQLIDAMHRGEPSAEDVVAKLRRPEYRLPNVEERRFLSYEAELALSERDMQTCGIPVEWATRALSMPTNIQGGFIDRVVGALVHVVGGGNRVANAFRECLERNDSIDLVTLPYFTGTGRAVFPDDDEGEEPAREYDQPLFRFRAEGMSFAKHMPVKTKVKDLFTEAQKVLGHVGPLKITADGNELNAESQEDAQTLGLTKQVLCVASG